MSIRLRGVRKSLGGRDVLNGLDLEVYTGETLSIIGYSGSGKSVTLKHIIGLMFADAGEVWVDDEEVGTLEAEALYELRRRVGYVFQFGALFDSMTIGQNVAMGLRRIARMEESQIQERVRECLRLVDLPDFEDRDPSRLSGGQRKRASLARAIATSPSYLLYDEPTTGLDPVTVAIIDRLIVRMADELGVTGIIVTHDMESAFRVSDRIAMLYEGKIRFVGTPDEIKACEDPVIRGFIEGKPELLERAM